MYQLRLQHEWETVTRHQYELELDHDGMFKTCYKQVDSDQCIKLLTRCKKMHEAKVWIVRLLKMTIEKDRVVEKLTGNQFVNATE